MAGLLAGVVLALATGSTLYAYGISDRYWGICYAVTGPALK